MSKRPFITQNDSPNIIIVPTVSFCKPPKKIKLVNNNRSNETWEQTQNSFKQPDSLSESISDDSVINTSASSGIKSEDSGHSMHNVNTTDNVNTTERLRQSWASNYLLGIGNPYNPIKNNLSSARKKIEALKENSSEKKITPQIKEVKSQQWLNDGSSCNTSKNILQGNLHPGNSCCSRPKTDYTSNKTKVKSIKPISEFDDTKTTMKPLNVSHDHKNDSKQYKERGSEKIAPSSSKDIATPDKYKYINKCDKKINETGSLKLYKEKRLTPSTSKYISYPTKYKFIKKTDQSTTETGSSKRYTNKILAPCTSKYVPTPNKYKLIKYDKNTNEYIKSNKDANNAYCEIKTSGDKIKYQQTLNKLLTKNKTLITPQQTIKSKVLKKPSRSEKNDTTSYLYDSQTLKRKEFYTNYKIPKIFDKNIKKEEPKGAELPKNEKSIYRLSAKDIFAKELVEAKCLTPVKSVVKVVDESEQKLDTNFDLRSKLSRRSLNHYFTKLRNLSESESTDNAARDQRDSLIITVANDTNEDIKTTGKRKLDDINTPNKKEAKTTKPKYKKIKLVINITCEKSATSSSDTEDEESFGDREKNNVISNLDLSFLDDFNIDEIVESLYRKETCDLTPTESKENAAKDLSFKDNPDDINNNKDVNTTNTEMFSVCITDVENERSKPMDSDNKIETGNSLSNETLISTDFAEAGINKKINKAITYTSYHSLKDKSTKAMDESLQDNLRKLIIADLHNSETKQDQNLLSSYIFSMKEYTRNCIVVNTEKEISNMLTVSNIIDIPKIAENIICKETRHAQESDKVPETRKTNKYVDNAYKASNVNKDSLENNNTVKPINIDVCSNDLVEENSSETISAIRMFLEANTTLHLNKKIQVDNSDKTSNSAKEISTFRINDTNSNNTEPFHIIDISTKSSEMYTSINKLEVNTIEDIKYNQEKIANSAVTSAGAIQCDTNKIKDNFGIKKTLLKNEIENKKDSRECLGIITNNNKVDKKRAYKTFDNIEDIKIDQEKYTNLGDMGGIEYDTYNVKDVVLYKNYTENTEYNVQESSGKNTRNNKNDNDVIEINEILKPSENIKKIQDYLGKTNIGNTERNLNNNIFVMNETARNIGVEDNKDVSKKLKREALGTNDKLGTNAKTELTKIVKSRQSFEGEKEKEQIMYNMNENVEHCEVIISDFTEFPLHPNNEVKKVDTDMKFEATTEISMHQSSIICSQSFDQKVKEFNICNKNYQKYDLSMLSKTAQTGTIDLTNESNENVEAFKEKCVVNSDVSVDKTMKNKLKLGCETNDLSILSNTEPIGIIDLTNESDEVVEAFKEKCVVHFNVSVDKTMESKVKSECEKVTEDVIKSTEYNRGSKIETSSQATNADFFIASTKYKNDTGSVTKIIEQKQKSETEDNRYEANDKSITERTKYEGELKTENKIKEDDASITKTIEHKLESKIVNSNQANNHESVIKTKFERELRIENTIQVDEASVTKIIEHKLESKTENSSPANNDEYVNKKNELKQELKIKNSNKADNEESVKKTTENKHQTKTTNTCQTSETVAVSENDNKEKADVTVDLQETDVYLIKILEDRMLQYLNKKHTITSLIHFGAFSRIYECVSENGVKYALKMMDGNKIYRNSSVEYLMKRLQKDVPKENYHCVYLFNGFGFTKHWCILMELYPKNLKQALQENNKSFHIDVIQNLSRQLVSAVTLLRHNNIVHTNITPTHIVVNSANDQLKLCGFDEAQYKNAINFSRNIGTMNYRSPEVILGHSADFKMDVWSTALVMYEMATNIQLFPGTVHNDILYKQMWVCGPIPCEMIRQSKYKNEHFQGLTFMRQLKGGKCTPLPYHIIRKHDLVKKYVYLTYKKDWLSYRSYNQKQQDYAKLHSFCQLLHQMIVIDPQVRLPIEFARANPFLFDVN